MQRKTHSGQYFEQRARHEDGLYDQNGCQKWILRRKTRLGLTHQRIPHPNTRCATCCTRWRCPGSRVPIVGRMRGEGRGNGWVGSLYQGANPHTRMLRVSRLAPNSIGMQYIYCKPMSICVCGLVHFLQNSTMPTHPPPLSSPLIFPLVGTLLPGHRHLVPHVAHWVFE